jgi:hypothetical protein
MINRNHFFAKYYEFKTELPKARYELQFILRCENIHINIKYYVTHNWNKNVNTDSYYQAYSKSK